MTEIMHVNFDIKEARDEVLCLYGPNIMGHVVTCLFEPGDHLDVVGIQCGNLAVLLPPDGVPASLLERFPLKLPISPALRMKVAVRAKAPARGRLYAVVHEPDPPPKFPPPPMYSLGLVPRE